MLRANEDKDSALPEACRSRSQVKPPEQNSTLPALEIEPFALSRVSRLLSWTDSERGLKLWSGNTFKGIPTSQTFISHLNRGNLHPFAGISQEGNFVAYGELVGVKKSEGIICRVIVEPKLRGQAYGRSFCSKLLHIAFHDLSYTHLTLNAFHFNTPAIRCYKALGFRQIAFRPKARRFKDENWDLVILRKERPLSP
jgi:RimJ/RimL family protein N-acetyltransferase